MKTEEIKEQKKPKVVAVYKEIELIGREIHLKLEDDDDGSEYYWVDPDPGVTETITCSDMVCSSGDFRFREKIISFPMKLVLPSTVKFADEVTVKIQKRKSV